MRNSSCVDRGGDFRSSGPRKRRLQLVFFNTWNVGAESKFAFDSSPLCIGQRMATRPSMAKAIPVRATARIYAYRATGSSGSSLRLIESPQMPQWHNSPRYPSSYHHQDSRDLPPPVTPISQSVPPSTALSVSAIPLSWNLRRDSIALSRRGRVSTMEGS